MDLLSETIHFKSSKFKIIEDEEVNPYCYGVELAAWIVKSLEARGYKELDVIAEDWGRCIIVEHKKHILFVGCGSVDDNTLDELEGSAYINAKNSTPIEWAIFVALEYPFFSNWFLSKEIKKHNEIKYKKLEADIIEIINSEPEFEKV